jgi:hypothetical protein
MTVTAVVRPAVTSAPATTTRAGQEAGEEGVELGHAILGNVDDDLLVLRGGSGFPIHTYSCRFAYGSKHSASKYLSKEVPGRIVSPALGYTVAAVRLTPGVSCRVGRTAVMVVP